MEIPYGCLIATSLRLCLRQTAVGGGQVSTGEKMSGLMDKPAVVRGRDSKLLWRVAGVLAGAGWSFHRHLGVVGPASRLLQHEAVLVLHPRHFGCCRRSASPAREVGSGALADPWPHKSPPGRWSWRLRFHLFWPWEPLPDVAGREDDIETPYRYVSTLAALGYWALPSSAVLAVAAFAKAPRSMTPADKARMYGSLDSGVPTVREDGNNRGRLVRGPRWQARRALLGWQGMDGADTPSDNCDRSRHHRRCRQANHHRVGGTHQPIRAAAAIICFFVGFGIHRFYVGRSAQASQCSSPWGAGGSGR